jgi:hypothetical protein
VLYDLLGINERLFFRKAWVVLEQISRKCQELWIVGGGHGHLGLLEKPPEHSEAP